MCGSVLGATNLSIYSSFAMQFLLGLNCLCVTESITDHVSETAPSPCSLSQSDLVSINYQLWAYRDGNSRERPIKLFVIEMAMELSLDSPKVT